MKVIFELDRNDIEKAIAAYVLNELGASAVKTVKVEGKKTTEGYYETEVIVISATVEVDK